MSDIEMRDMSGQPRSDEELRQALEAVERSMVRDMMKLPPELFVQLPVIRDALISLLTLRELAGSRRKGP